jgi:chemotaxis regulatin CheY-phosphate phosphatase CheZ
MDKAFVAQKVANKLWSAENTVDAAMADAAALMAELAAARQELKFSAQLTEKATADLVNAISSLGQARAALTEMHDELTEVKLRLGIRTKLVGGWDKHLATAEEDLRKTA